MTDNVGRPEPISASGPAGPWSACARPSSAAPSPHYSTTSPSSVRPRNCTTNCADAAGHRAHHRVPNAADPRGGRHRRRAAHRHRRVRVPTLLLRAPPPLVCRACGFTVEVDGPAVEQWSQTIADTNGFTDVSHTVEIFGTCRTARKLAESQAQRRARLRVMDLRNAIAWPPTESRDADGHRGRKRRGCRPYGDRRSAGVPNRPPRCRRHRLPPTPTAP